MKPIKEAELREALDRLNSINNNVLIKEALIKLESKVEEQKLVLITQKGPKGFLLRQITHIEGERNYSFIHLSDGSKELSSKTLAYFEEVLEDKGFFRCHRSYLINKHHIALLKQDNFVLKNDLGIPISRRKKTIARNWFI